MITFSTLSRPPAGQRWKELAAWVAAEDPDVICLQECRRQDGLDVSSWLASWLPGAWFAAFGGAGGPGGCPSGSAVVSRWLIEHRAQSHLECQDAWPKLLLHVRTCGLDVYCVHLAAALDGAAVREAQVLFVPASSRRLRAGRQRFRPFWPAISTPGRGLRRSPSCGGNARWQGGQPFTRMPGRLPETARASPGTTPARSPLPRTATTRAVTTCSPEPRKSPSAGARERARTSLPPDR